MIRFNLKKILAKLEKETGQKILLKDISERSGCDKNALSRMVNHPGVVPSAAVVDKLVQFFFHEFKNKYDRMYSSIKRSPKWIMDLVLRDFISVYPDDENYWIGLPQEIRDNPESVSLDTIWSIYSSLNSLPGETINSADIKPSSILDAIEPVQIEEDGTYTIKMNFPKSHFEFVREKLPDLLETLFADPKLESPATSKSLKKNRK